MKVLKQKIKVWNREVFGRLEVNENSALQQVEFWDGMERERSNQGRLTSAMRRFAQVVDELKLIDLPLQGGLLTWSGGRNNQAWARLDRFQVTQPTRVGLTISMRSCNVGCPDLPQITFLSC